LVSLGIPKLSNLPDTCALMTVSPRMEKPMAKSRRTTQRGTGANALHAADKPGRQPGIYHRTPPVHEIAARIRALLVRRLDLIEASVEADAAALPLRRRRRGRS
jgi:hypothetical protein